MAFTPCLLPQSKHSGNFKGIIYTLYYGGVKMCRIVEESVKARDWITLLLSNKCLYFKKLFESKNRIILNTFNRNSQRLAVMKLNELSWQLCLNFFATNCLITYSTLVKKIIENLTKFVFAMSFVYITKFFFLYLSKEYNVCIIKTSKIVLN